MSHTGCVSGVSRPNAANTRQRTHATREPEPEPEPGPDLDLDPGAGAGTATTFRGTSSGRRRSPLSTDNYHLAK